MAEEGVEMQDIDLVETIASSDGVTKGALQANNTSQPVSESPSEMSKMSKKEKSISIVKMFTYADWKDVVLMLMGTISAVLHGSAQIIHILLLTRALNRFVDLAKLSCPANSSTCYNSNSTTNVSVLTREMLEEEADELLSELTNLALYYLPVAFGVFVTATIAISSWNLAGYRQALRIRRALFSSIMHQDLSWYDVTTSTQLTNRLSDDVEKIQAGLGDRVAVLVQYTSTFCFGFAVAFVVNWKLALVVLGVMPLMMVAVALLTKLSTAFIVQEQNAYARAGAIAEEVISSIRTVTAFGGEKKEVERYSGELSAARRIGIKRGVVTGALLGVVMGMFFCSYSLAFWFGSLLATECPVEDQLPLGDLFTVFICIIIGGFSLGQAAPELENFLVGRGSASVVYRIIERVPAIDGRSPLGLRPEKIDQVVELKNVHFVYPARPDVPVLQGLDLSVKPGQTLALVGPSGCGKSTVVQMIQRFYDVHEGQVLVGGHDVRDLNIHWLRNNIGVVSQEPVLFATTISENIRLGKEDATLQEIEAAAIAANAHSFISELPDGYNTLVGERGTQLSGGQKQRIAIARALVRDPKILLLDEATSALDTESEAQVQAALDKARQGRTTIVIAHRLSTVQTADVIAAIKSGRVAELGTHSELMDSEGVYYDLVTAQKVEVEEEDTTEPLADFKSAIKRPHKMSYTRQASNLSSCASPSIVEKSPSVSRKFSLHSEVDKSQKASDIAPEEPWNPTCLDLVLGRLKQQEQKEEEPLPPAVPMRQLLALNKPEWYFVLLGVFAAAVLGAVQPTLSIVFGEMLEILGGCNEEEVREMTRETVPYFVLIGGIVFMAHLLQGSMLGIASEKLTLRLRQETFKAFLHQDMGWFDLPENSTGTLTTRLAVDASLVKGATGVSFGVVVQALSALSVALGIAFYSSWQLTLVILGCVPFVMLSGAYQVRNVKGRTLINKKLLENAGRLASEAIENVRTVHSLGVETSFTVLYNKTLKEPFKLGTYGSCVQGMVYGISQGILFLLYCIAFSFSRYLVEEGLVEYQDVFRTLTAIVLTSIVVGRLSSYAPEIGKARIAASQIFQIINSEPSIDPYSEDGIKPDSNTASVEIDSVSFNYPTRQEMTVLSGLDIAINPGQTVALVGPSGCGKSTVIQLLLRFYDPWNGKLCLDGIDLRMLNIQWLRSQIGLVSQEPVLFDATIADNIRYGANFREVTNEEVEKAAKSANIHDFITSLPQGYQTNVGSRGTQISGGQKQRVAIARALIRDPKILLLDEATSALDTESEKIVQEALDSASQDRTSIIIAHRLSTIQNADCIAVIHNGQVIEKGTHKELLALKGAYYLLSTAH